MGNKNGAPVLRQEDIDALTNTSGMDEAQVVWVDNDSFMVQNAIYKYIAPTKGFVPKILNFHAGRP